MKKIILITAICALGTQAQSQWSLTGNAGTNATNNFIGTKDNVAFNMRTNNTVRMSINAAGKVGIGTTSPQNKFHVSGTGALARFGAGTTASTFNYWSTGNDVGSYIEQRGNTTTTHSDNFRIQSSKSGLGVDYTQFQIDPTNGFLFVSLGAGNGNVGIGTYTPTSLLSVKSSVIGPVAFLENTSNVSSNSSGLFIKAGSNGGGANYLIGFFRPDGFQIGGVVQTSANSVIYATASDKRLKNIIGASQKGLADLMKIKIYDYTFKADQNKQVLTGFMAQELYDVFPQSVSKPRDENEPAEKNPWMVDYGSVTPLIIKSVQEQQQMIDELKKSNDDLKKQNAEMKSRLDKFEMAFSQSSTSYQSEIDHPKSAMLEQNIPNPFNQQTVIRFYIPASVKSALIKITDAGDKELKSFLINDRGSSQISISANTLDAGVYIYQLMVDGKSMDAKQMIITNK